MKMDWQEAEKFFLEAAAMCAADVAPGAIPDFPGFWIRRFERSPYRYMDCATPDSESQSLGLRVIWLERMPIWWMQYDENRIAGDKRVAPFVNRVLAETYASGLFSGGRGRDEFVWWPLKYENRPTLNGFRRFAGCDFVTDTDRRQLLLSCNYRGMALV